MSSGSSAGLETRGSTSGAKQARYLPRSVGQTKQAEQQSEDLKSARQDRESMGTPQTEYNGKGVGTDTVEMEPQ